MRNRILELGEKDSVWLRDVVCVLDADTATVSAATRDFLKKCRDKGIVAAPKGKVKMVNSLVLTNAFGKDRLVPSPYTPARIAKNANDPFAGTRENLLNE